MRRGFTILEVLLAMVLGTALLACLWSALSMYLRAFDAGRTEVEQSQLLRALVRKIETDLQRTLPQARKSNPSPVTTASAEDVAPWTTSSMTANETSALGEFPIEVSDTASLVGTATQLRIRIRRPTLRMQDVFAVDQLGNEVVPIHDDLKTIYYWLANANDSAGSAAGPALQGSGLVRREGAWLRWRDAAGDAQPVQAGDLSDPDDATDFYQSLLPEEHQHAASPELVIAPEVAGLQFRYFDGTGWREAWNSETEGGLPRAVEVSIFLARDTEEYGTAVETGVDSQGNSVPIADYRFLAPLPVEPTSEPQLTSPKPDGEASPLTSPSDEVWP